MTDTSASPVVYQTQADLLSAKWGWFLALGFVLIGSGAWAVAMPAISTHAAGVVLGSALAVAGVAKIIQSFQVKEWSGFIWQELAGAVEFVGGILIFLNPLKGALAITLLVALIFCVQGIAQIILAIKTRRQVGAKWLLASGCVALAASAVLTLKLPYSRAFTPGTIAGISLLVAGAAYAAIALSLRRARP